MTAVIEGLKALKHPCDVTIYSDSAYVVNAIRQNWLRNWKKKGWLNASKQPVANRDLWEELDRLMGIHETTFIKVKGHSDHDYNNRCDALAVAAVDRYKKEHNL
jgi:ribonuclease HI